MILALLFAALASAGVDNAVLATVPVGDRPMFACWSEQSNKVYVSNYYGDNMTVIDGVNNRVLGSVPVGNGPANILHVPSRNEVVVSPDLNNNMRIVDCATDRVVASLYIRQSATGMVWSPVNNRVYVAANNVGVVVLDMASHTVAKTIGLGGGRAQRICYNATGNKVYVTTFDGRVHVINCATNTVVKALTLSTGLGDLVWNSRKNRVYVTNYTTGMVTVIDGTTDSVSKMINAWPVANPSLACYDPTHDRVWIAGNGVVRIDCSQDDWVGYYTPAGQCPQSLYYNALDDKVYCANWGSGNVTVIDAASCDVVATVPTGAGSYGFCHNTTNDKLYVPNENSDNVTVIAGSGIAATTVRALDDLTTQKLTLGTHGLTVEDADISDDKTTLYLWVDGEKLAIPVMRE